MGTIDKAVSVYYKNLAEIYINRVPCLQCCYKDTGKCHEHKDYCAETLYITMKELLKK